VCLDVSRIIPIDNVNSLSPDYIFNGPSEAHGLKYYQAETAKSITAAKPGILVSSLYDSPLMLKAHFPFPSKPMGLQQPLRSNSIPHYEFQIPSRNPIPEQNIVFNGYSSVQLADKTTCAVRRLEWGSDTRFVGNSYAAAPDQSSEEEIIKRMLRENSSLIKQYTNTITQLIREPLIDCSLGARQTTDKVDDSWTESLDYYIFPSS
jgi:hypothetical protein